MDADRGDDHDREHERGPDRAQEAERHEQAAADLGQGCGGGEEAAGTKAQGLEHAGDGCEPVAAEPAEELLRAVGCNQEPENESKQ